MTTARLVLGKPLLCGQRPGLGLARRIAADPGLSGTPVLMLTARGFRLSAEEFAGSGIVEVLAKPFSPRMLVERILDRLDGPGSQRSAA